MDSIEQNYRFLRLLNQQPEITQREIAQVLGISLGKTNHVLNGLVDSGLVEISNIRNSSNKVSYVYLLTPKGVNEKVRVSEALLQRKYDEYESIRSEIEFLEQEIG